MARVYLIPEMAASPAGYMYGLKPLLCISPDLIVLFCKAEIDYDKEIINRTGFLDMRSSFLSPIITFTKY